MFSLIAYLEREIINDEYCKKCNIKLKTFYLKTNYTGEINIISLININFYEKLIQYKLVEAFNEDLNTYFKYHNIKNFHPVCITAGSVIKYKVSHDNNFVNVSLVYPTYISKLDPLLSTLDTSNSNLTKVLEAGLHEINNNPAEDIITNIDIKDCTVISNNYDILVFKTNKYFIKATQNINNYNELAHEAYINYSLNIHTKNPNLPNVPKFIGFDTIDHIIKMAPVQTHWTSPINYLIIENVEGIPFGKYLLTQDFNNIKNVIKQIFYFLYDIHNKIKFTHYDLHFNNILIKKLKAPIIIQYSQQTIETNHLAIIIDFEFSYVNIEDINVGIEQHEVNIFNKSFWIHDIFKFLMTLFKACHDKKWVNNDLIKIYDLSIILLDFFFPPGYHMTLMEWCKYSEVKSYINLRYIKFHWQFEDFIDYFNKCINSI